MVMIQIPDRPSRVRGMGLLAGRARVVCLPDDTFVVPEPAVESLRREGVQFLQLGRGGSDYAEKALRDSLAPQAQ